MQAVEIHDHARKLFESMGPKAIAEAAKRAREFEERGEKSEAQDWRRIEAALAEMRGPRAK